MFPDFLTLLADLAERRDPGWGKLLPMLIIGILYALGHLVKNKQAKQPPKRPSEGPRPLQPTAPPKRRLPSYARGRDTTQQPTTSQPRPQQPQQPAASQPRPQRAQPTQRTVPPARPVVKPSATPQRVPRMAQRVSTPPPRRAKPTTAPQKPQPHAARPKPAAPAQPAPRRETTVTAHALRSPPDHTHTQEQVTYGAGPKLQIALNDPSDLVRAVVYAEVLGKPMALRPTGSFEFGF